MRSVLLLFSAILAAAVAAPASAQIDPGDAVQGSDAVPAPPGEDDEVRPPSRSGEESLRDRSATPRRRGRDALLPESRGRLDPSEAPLPGRIDGPLTPRSDPAGPGGSPPSGSLTGGSGAALQAADLALEGPAVAEQDDGESVRYSHTWTVSNAGPKRSHSVTFALGCEDNRGEGGEVSCGLWDVVVQVPPLAPGESFPISSAGQGWDPVATIDRVQSPADPEELVLEPHWLRFTATVDPDGTNLDVDRGNNSAEYLLANMPRHPGLTEAATKKATDVRDAIDEAGQAKLEDMATRWKTRRYEITTEDPWVPGTPVWVLVQNVSDRRAPESTVIVDCVDLNKVEYNRAVEEWLEHEDPDEHWFPPEIISERCEFPLPGSLSVPALDPGEFHALYQLSTPPVDPEPDPSGNPLENLPDPNFGGPPEFPTNRYAITFQGPAAGEVLRLSTEPEFVGKLPSKRP